MIDLAQRYCGFDIVEDLFYSRRNFIQPAMQESMHSSFETEVTYLDSKIGGGAPYIMGKVNIDCRCYHCHIQYSNVLWFRLVSLHHCNSSKTG